MRLTTILFVHNKTRFTKLKWEILRKQRIPDSHIVGRMENLQVQLSNPQEIVEEVVQNLGPKPPRTRLSLGKSYIPKEQRIDKKHPLYQECPCLILGDSNVLLEGLEQAKVLLNTVQVENGLPSSIENLVGKLSLPDQDKRVTRSIMHSHVYEAMQVKLPIKKDPSRPAWNFPRDYGISSHRKFELITSDVLQLCDIALGPSSVANRIVISDASCNVRLSSCGDELQFESAGDVLVTSRSPLPALTSRSEGSSVPLPDLYPLAHTVSLAKSHFYHEKSIYPVSRDASISHPHTIIVHYEPERVKNLYEEPVTETQIMGRTLTKAFTAAASRAHQLYGNDVKQLPEPLSVQVIQTDGRRYHFGVFQLNTLDIGNSQGEKNIFWMLPILDMFSVCEYVRGRPTLEGYNPEVFQRILAFYTRGLTQSD